MHQHSPAWQYRRHLPTEPVTGTFSINFNMTAVVDTGVGKVDMTVDLNSPITWWPDKTFECFNNATGEVNDTDCTPAFKYPGGGSFGGNAYRTPSYIYSFNDHVSYVEGHLVNGSLEMAGFHVSNQLILFAEKFESNSSVLAPGTAMSNVLYNSSSGVLGLASTGTIYSTAATNSISSMSSCLLNNILALPNGMAPVNVISLLLPRKSETGKIVIGGKIETSSVVVSESVTVIDSQNYVDGNSSYASHMISVDALGPPGTFFEDNPIKSTYSQGWYVLDTTSDVIKTSWDASKALGDLFTPPAIQNSAGVFEVVCSATLPKSDESTVMLSIGEKKFWIREVDLIVHRPDGTCVSALQAATDNDTFRLGWPFLRNVVLFFDARDTTNKTVEISWRAVSASAEQSSAALASITTNTVPGTGASTLSTTTVSAQK